MVYLSNGFGNVEVWVQSERERLPEYDLRGPPQAATWIPSTDDTVSAFSTSMTSLH